MYATALFHEIAALVRLLPLRDRFDVGAERVREVVRLDDEAARFDDLALDLAELLVDLVERSRTWRRSSSTRCLGAASGPVVTNRRPWPARRHPKRHQDRDRRRPVPRREHSFVKPEKGSRSRARRSEPDERQRRRAHLKIGESVGARGRRRRKMTYSWEEGDNYVFMDTSTGDQI